MAKQMNLNVFAMTTGHHEASWRLPETDPYASLHLDHYLHLAQVAERGTFDSIFLADNPSVNGDVRRRPLAILDPLILLTAIATATERIGLIATVSTSYNSPYNLARRLASLDHLSRGRVGWNVVTTSSRAAGRNFGVNEETSHRQRYERASEFIDVAHQLWDSWHDDAILADKERGIWAEPRGISSINHQGEYFTVTGPLNVPRSPQGHPVLVQAGSSEDGKNLAARHAEAVFTAHQTLGEAQYFYDDVKARAESFGRDPESVKILPGIVPILGSTEAEAQANERALQELIVHEYALENLAATLNVGVEKLKLDELLPADLPDVEAIEGAQSRYALVIDLARRENLTVRALLDRLGAGRGHQTVVGTPEQIADAMQEWFTSGGADGFNVMPASLPGGLELFVEHVVPILRARGLFRTEYHGSTLRDHLGLAYPPRPGLVPAASGGSR